MAKSPREAACAHVARKFPYLKGCRPKVKRQGKSRIYTFKGSVETSPGGPKVNQVVRVTVDPDGKVLKVVASR